MSSTIESPAGEETSAVRQSTSADNELTQLRERHEILKATLKQAQLKGAEDAHQVQIAIAHIKEKHAQIEMLTREHNEMVDDFEALQADHTTISEEHSKCTEKIKSLSSTNSRLHKIIVQLVAEAKKEDNKMASLKKGKADLRKEYESLRKSLAEAHMIIQSLSENENNAELRSQNEELQADFVNAINRADRLFKELNDEKDISTNLEKKVKELEKKLNFEQEKNQELSNYFKSIKRQMDEKEQRDRKKKQSQQGGIKDERNCCVDIFELSDDTVKNRSYLSAHIAEDAVELTDDIVDAFTHLAVQIKDQQSTAEFTEPEPVLRRKTAVRPSERQRPAVDDSLQMDTAIAPQPHCRPSSSIAAAASVQIAPSAEDVSMDVSASPHCPLSAIVARVEVAAAAEDSFMDTTTPVDTCSTSAAGNSAVAARAALAAASAASVMSMAAATAAAPSAAAAQSEQPRPSSKASLTPLEESVFARIRAAIAANAADAAAAAAVQSSSAPAAIAAGAAPSTKSTKRTGKTVRFE